MGVAIRELHFGQLIAQNGDTNKRDGSAFRDVAKQLQHSTRTSISQ